MDKKEWSFIDRWAKKYKAVQSLGGKCVKCGNDDFRVLVFHHEGNKDFWYHSKNNGRFSLLEKELKKCILLCPNCHFEYHFKDIEVMDDRNKQAKEMLLEIKNTNQCVKCGYDVYIGALDFHHKEGYIKTFSIGNEIGKCSKIDELGSILIEELEKCDVLCKNCHVLEHIDKDKIEQLLDNIKNKKWRGNNKAPTEEIIRLHNEGYRNIEITKLLNIPKSTVSTILTNFATVA